MHTHRRRIDAVEDAVVIDGKRQVLGVCLLPDCDEPTKWYAPAAEDWSQRDPAMTRSVFTRRTPVAEFALAEDRTR